jgi:ABC-type nitrate/sulfonate/bicarbonate transport system permease component
MIPKWLIDIRGRVPAKIALLLGLIPIVAAIFLWWALTSGDREFRTIPYTILPSPKETIEKVSELFSADKKLFASTLLSLKRIGLGYLLALVVTLPLGVLMGSFGSIRSIFAPTVTASGYLPIATLVPLTMAWFGIGEKQKVMFLALAFGIYLLPAVIGAIDGVPDIYLRTASTLGASRRTLVFRVLIPVAGPGIWQGMRLAFGVGWTYLVLTEVVVREGGLGDLIEISRRRGPPEHVYLIIILITLIAWIADIAWVQLGHLLFPYRRTR